MKKFTVEKRNRKYFSARTENGHPCKILIDSSSESLEPGEHMLEIEDISVRSKYGVDLIFKLKAPIEDIKTAGICTLKTRYNKRLVEECRNLGGKWDADAGAWIFSGIVADKVDELDDIYNSPDVPVEITFLREAWAKRDSVTLVGYEVARAFGRDSGAKLGEGISLMKGRADSGGSMKNWYTEVQEGTVIRMMIPEALLPELDRIDYVDYVRMDGVTL